ncbi:transporter substrate-binding domain-containing protein [Vibrio rumoiensis]|uniref:Amino acid ABC transporter substrate-binding protein n=1 Tax=Vibrio rumoiensis 1S-45 TaxID=1188252 RepID=A0A1E5E0X2_9VIBR|nr:transporter substrate-binding domain-containing protein [Vibrio rumoiensis]OEF24097.1 amino acid ABC transporter substrate-binding protein [Vibrio rumoiensis 1S-45]
MLKIKGWFFIVSLMLVSHVTQARTWDEIVQSGELRVGMAGDYSPLSFRNKLGQLVGFDVDMTKQLAKALNLEIQFVQTSWPTISKDLAEDKFDIAAGGVTYTENRAKQFSFSSSVAKNGKIILSHCNQAARFETLEEIDQPDVKVIVNPGGTNEIYVNSHIKQARVIRVKDNFANLQGIRNKTADVMITDLIEGHFYQLHEKGVFCISSSDILDGTMSFKAYMMKKDNPELLEKVNHWLDSGSKFVLAKQWQVVQ